MSATTVKERPILFNGEMVRAILDGRKTQTRRLMKPQPKMHSFTSFTEPVPFMPVGGIHQDRWLCPYGKPGDRLWVRETWAKSPKGIIYRADFDVSDGSGSHVIDIPTGEMIPLIWKPSIHMPRWASRLTLEITERRIERPNDISEADAMAEGFDLNTSARVLRTASGKSRMEFARWLELPDGSEPDGYWCLDCVDKAAKKLNARICGWNDCFDADHAPRCNECGRMLSHSLTDYGVKTELGLTDGDGVRVKCTPAHGDHALALAELAEGMGDWSDKYVGRLAQIGFGTTWESINGPGSWEANPWVWVVGFKRIDEGAAQ